MRKANTFADWFPDQMTRKNGALSTLGRPGFSSSIGSRKNFPSKWDDAEKWVMNNGHESPSHGVVKSQDLIEKHQKTSSIFQGPKIVSLDHHHVSSDKAFNGVLASESTDVLLKGKLPYFAHVVASFAPHCHTNSCYISIWFIFVSFFICVTLIVEK